ncbi:hypothetical protein TNCV_4685851 [Trichonephila clavipes]|nr:hypothetical protein TNCV_4685851 [Trichonephila clavipes]
MSTFNIPILPFFVHIFKNDSAVEKNNSTRPRNSKIKANAGEKQLNSSVGTKNSTQLGNMNETTQKEKTTQLSSRNEQLNSSVGTKQPNSALPSTACNRLQPPATTCNRLHRLYSRIGFFTYSPLPCALFHSSPS